MKHMERDGEMKKKREIARIEERGTVTGSTKSGPGTGTGRLLFLRPTTMNDFIMTIDLVDLANGKQRLSYNRYEGIKLARVCIYFFFLPIPFALRSSPAFFSFSFKAF